MNKELSKKISISKDQIIEEKQCYILIYVQNNKTNEITFISGKKLDVVLHNDSDLEPITGMVVTSGNENDPEELVSFFGVPEKELLAAFEAFEKSNN